MHMHEIVECKNGGDMYLRPTFNPKQFVGWIQLTAHRELKRTERLADLAEMLAALGPETAFKVGRFHDHKGFLTVVWVEEPSKREMEIINWLWGSPLCREVASNVVHLVPREPIDESPSGYLGGLVLGR